MATGQMWHVARVDATTTFTLRQQVLRPHQGVAEAGFPGDDDPDTRHFAAYFARADRADTDTHTHAHTHTHTHADADAAGAADVDAAPDGKDPQAAVAVVTVLRQFPAPLKAGNPETCWRLRGMATDERYRGRGAGSALVTAALAYLAGCGGEVLWCNARLSTVGFYRRAGFVTTGDPWDEPALGPHVAMWRTVPRTP